MVSKVSSISSFSDSHTLIGPADKTQVFCDWIEQKQKELEPWKTKINQKQAEVNVKTSEHDMLVKQAEAVERAGMEALEALETVKGDQKAKVHFRGLAMLPTL